LTKPTIFFRIRYVESFIGSDGAWGAYAELNVATTNPGLYLVAAIQYLVGSLSMSNDPYPDNAFGSVNEDGALRQSDFPIAYGRRPRLTTTALAIFAATLVLVTITVSILLWSRVGTAVEPLLLRHFGLPLDTRLWQVADERYVSKMEELKTNENIKPLA